MPLNGVLATARVQRACLRYLTRPLGREVLLVAERAALLTGRDDEFTMLVTIGFTGMRWSETISLECCCSRLSDQP